VIVILDGADPIAEKIASEFGVEVLRKEPAGPTKGAALAWAADRIDRGASASSRPPNGGLHIEANSAPVMGPAGSRRPAGESLEAILILDVGSRVDVRFFEAFRWKHGSDAMQALIAGRGTGAGDAAAVSERVAQTGEDRGRERLGWAIRLRGTGTAFRPATLREIASQLRTQVEDLESSLLLAAAGRVLTLSEARILDEKPQEVARAAVQRGRWLAGKAQVLARHPDAILRLIQRNPAEGVAFVSEILGRPLVLSALVRCAAGGALLMESRNGWRAALGAIALGSVALDVAVHARQGATTASGAKILAAWAGALVLAPRALARWMKARKS
jgi:hypothetical protein